MCQTQECTSEQLFNYCHPTQEVRNGSILVIGSQQVGKHALVTRLLHPAVVATKTSQSQQLWHLDTKYYTTDVSICTVHPTGQASQLATNSQGLVLVFAADLEESFLAISQWAEQLPSSLGEVRLCVANKADTIAAEQHNASGQAAALQHSSWLDAATIWCAENQFEYIETSSTNSQLDETLVWEEQQQGIQRVKQALEANYWPNIAMKHPQMNRELLNGSHPSSETAVVDAADGDDNATTSSNGSDQAEDSDFDAFQSAEEAQLDQFDKMFGELRATRDELQQLPREQRHQAAADLALRIASVLGLEEESECDLSAHTESSDDSDK